MKESLQIVMPVTHKVFIFFTLTYGLLLLSIYFLEMRSASGIGATSLLNSDSQNSYSSSDVVSIVSPYDFVLNNGVKLRDDGVLEF